MDNSIRTRFKKAWNVFLNKDPTTYYSKDLGPGNYYRPDRVGLVRGSEKTIVTAIYNRIAVDVASIDIRHVQLDENGRYVDTIPSNLNECLSVEANIDQSARAFMVDVVLSLFDEGYVAIIPVDTDHDIRNTNSYDVLSMRTGKIVEWYPKHVKVSVYNENEGKREDVIISKSDVAIVENPFYSVMNERNSIMQRLIRKLNLLDFIDEEAGSGKLNMIIQLPYIIKTEARRNQAEDRRKEIEKQLVSSKYGIAYTDGTEHITQLNRPLDNKLFEQVQYLTDMAYSQLGIDVTILNGTADDKTMINYNSRIVEPIISAIVEAMRRVFLTKTARTQGQSIMFFKDPFKLVPVSEVAEIADKFTRNEIMTSNEVRQIVGMKPSDDPEADELRNKNLNQSKEDIDAKAAQDDQVKSMVNKILKKNNKEE